MVNNLNIQELTEHSYQIDNETCKSNRYPEIQQHSSESKTSKDCHQIKVNPGLEINTK